MNKSIRISVLLILMLIVVTGFAQDTVHYIGTRQVNIDYHHGQLSPALGVHNIQVMRANRELPETAEDLGWTYNHAPNLSYWNHRFYYHYLNNPVGEHIPPGRTMLSTSEDGYNWSKPVTIFPEYKIPDGTTKEGMKEVAKDLVAVMHQRMGFYVSNDNRLLCLAYYGISLNKKDSPNDGNGIGRVVREIYKDGSFGPIYFIRYNHGWSEKNTDFPFYKKSNDTGFVDACDELLDNPLMMQQWVEEADRDDPLIPVKNEYKALSFYHLPDSTVVGLWKHALTATSNDEGKTWTTPLRAPVKIEKQKGQRWLALRNKDEFDYAKATRLFPATKNANVEFTIKTGQSDTVILHVELQDEKNTAALRLIFDNNGILKYKAGYRINSLGEYEAGKEYTIRIEATTNERFYHVYINEERVLRRLFFSPVHQLDKIVFRTGEVRRFPNADTPTDQDFDVPQTGEPVPEAAFFIKSLKTKKVAGKAAILKADDFKHYVDYFNRMEDENIVQAISNAESWEWMKANVPLFECPQDNFEQMFYYRWRTLRKHIKQTPVGFAMTEFLVERSYSDEYNLIACAMGHHTMESRWLHDSKYLDQYLHVWYRGNEGQPMKYLHRFSSWTPAALLGKYYVDNNQRYLLDMLPDLVTDYELWEQERRLSNGLFWQEDVKDGMEEQISGGRRVKNARPTINSYIYANAVAIAKIAELKGDKALQKRYLAKADTLKHLIQTRLWNPEMNFYETIREKTNDYAGVREAIGYIPWYFNIPGNEQTVAWEQITSEEGFLCPYGLTTAERRHPEFRTHGCCTCEWDGAVWPFATSQTLTGLANLLNNYNQEIINDSIYFRYLELYVESQYHRGRPYIGEYQDEVTGYWLKGDQERSRYYNHSTFNDLIITGLAGLRPRDDNKIEVNPLIQENKWDWFCLDKVLYHGKIVSIIWDKNGDKYHLGKGLTVLVDGKAAGSSDKLDKIICDL
ncbi:trehalase family glycosidase [Draconibacterium sp.]|nr:trehalase family glycosidase [Draconibacterium sp.]